ncbi:hypothetical protein [Ardenticatena maritima]|uniref:Uncharacterized protein n=2 Tax=Ardenticatena maritima TaxID=872965 RepID=A0A0P6YT45_9CHLR|nr:hypothetical protein [Ardenticatena maritima]KPL88257.1 hypothetical protein SE16_05270 [Ardenticatena maritima]
MSRPLIARLLFMLGVLSIMVWWALHNAPSPLRGKPAAYPLTDTLSPEQRLAQDLALADPRVQAYTAGRRSEVFGVRRLRTDVPPSAAECRQPEIDCRQVELYVFEADAAVIAIVNVNSRTVLDVFYQPGVRPGINKRLAERAQAIALNAPEVQRALGFRPTSVDMAPVDADMVNSVCEAGHLCVGPTFRVGNRILWAIVDLTDERLVGTNWTTVAEDGASIRFTAQTCPQPGTVQRDGWSLAYETTSTDGLRIFDVSFYTHTLLTSAKLVEWHVDYGTTGFRDSTGCGDGGGGFAIAPYGETEVRDLRDASNAYLGFEIVQDFRMSNWGASCNYRYEQHMQFFTDGRFRIVGGAYGRGCSTDPVYRPVLRIDIALDGDNHDTLRTSNDNGQTWNEAATETWWLQNTPTTNWVISDTLTNTAYRLIPGEPGLFAPEERGDYAYIYLTRHHPDEGDSDLGSIGGCCNDNHQQGPDLFIDGEAAADTNIVLWYVPQMQTDASGDDANGFYCWTVNGEPTPETYPCFAGPLFEPLAPLTPPQERLFLPLIEQSP